MTKLSIIIPHYKDEENLERLIDTIPENPNFQIIIVDNTPDYNISALEKLKKKNRFVEIYQIETGGAGAARNLGLEKVVHEWVLFADSDDIFLEGFYEKILSVLDGAYDVVYFAPQYEGIARNCYGALDHRTRYAELVETFNNEQSEVNEWTLRLRFDVPWSKLIKYDFLQKNNIYFDCVKKQNDTIFSQKVGLLAQKVQISPLNIYCTIDNPHSITHQLSKDYYEDAVEVRVRSCLMQRERVSKAFLKECNPKIFLLPLATIRESYRFYRSLGYSLQILNRFKQNKVPIFSLAIFEICINLAAKNMVQTYHQNFKRRLQN
ncbi:MAG: glycosyltransferase family 2 protein [Enterococcus sp.]